MTLAGVALCAAIPIDGETSPEWLHLLPAGVAHTRDGRGPYRLADEAALIATSMEGGKLAIDENHATDLAAPKGAPAPAHGWITELQSRDSGIWGRVEWVNASETVPIWKRYRGISPVIKHTPDFRVKAILRASLTNTPNLTGLQTLHSTRSDMELRTALLSALGLSASNSDQAIIAAVKALRGNEDKPQSPAMRNAIALQSARSLAQRAADYQARMAAGGVSVSIIDAVQAVENEA